MPDKPRVSLRVTLLLCGVEILGLAGLATFAALLPFFLEAWGLSNVQAGWLSAVYYGAYVLAVPLLTVLTDRRDARGILLFGLLTGVAAALGFAWLAEGFWSALVFRFLAGVSLAGVYMPGLKLLRDHVAGPRQSRYVSFYTASFSVGASLSYLLAGEVHAALGWRWAFAASGLLTLAGVLLAGFGAPPGRVDRNLAVPRFAAGLAVVLRSRQAMAYILGYAAHMWELFSLRSWMVAFLAFSRQLQPGDAAGLSPTQVVALVNLIGLPASIGGNELCRRLGRPKTIVAIMLVSALIGFGIGFAAPLPYGMVVALALFYGVVVLGDSASLTAGAVASAPAGGRGATLAVHSTLGFTAAFLGPLATGLALDLLQGTPTLAWGAAFVVMGLGSAVGPLALALLKGKGAAPEAGKEDPPR
jgi:MFS family permease